MQSWRDTIEKLGSGKRLVIGGKSLGGRIASMIADETGVRGLVCLGYPFHPPGKPEQTRFFDAWAVPLRLKLREFPVFFLLNREFFARRVVRSRLH
jgi:pimeloyl-ACP methyl ester carboxylesterase